MRYGVKGLLIVAGVLFLMTSCSRNGNAQKNEINIQHTEKPRMNETKLQENPYPGFREQSFSISAEKLGLTLDNSKTVAYGIIMEWDIEDAIVSLVTFQTGDASIYLSTGQIFIGGLTHEEVKQSAIELVELGQEYLKLAKPATETPHPDKACVRFYFLTNKGKFYVQDRFANIENNNSNLTKLFVSGNKVITAYRKVTENK